MFLIQLNCDWCYVKLPAGHIGYVVQFPAKFWAKRMAVWSFSDQVEAVCYFNKRVWSSTCDKSASLTSSDTELKTTADIMPCCESYDRMRMGRGNYL